MKRIALTVAALSAVFFINATTIKIGADQTRFTTGPLGQSGKTWVDDAVPLADQFFAGDGSAFTAAKWGPNGGPYSVNFTAGNVANFNVVDGTGSGAAGISIGGINAIENFTYSSPSGTLTTGGTIAPINVSPGKTLNLSSINFSTAAGTGFSKSGGGVFITSNGNAYPGGFTLNEGTIIVGGVNAMGGGGANTLTINGGTIAANNNRDLSGKYPLGITVGGNFQLGALTTDIPLSSSTANLTFNNAVAIGAPTRTIAIGANGNYTFSGVVSGAAGSGVTVNSNLAATGILTFSGANTFTGPTTISGGILSVTTVDNGGVASGLGQSTSAATNLVFDGGTLRYSGTVSGVTNRNFTINNGKNATIEVVGAGTDLTMSGGSVASSGGLTKSGTGALILSGTHLYTGDTVLNAGGALALIGSGSIASSQSIEVKGGAFFDVAGLLTPLTLASGQVLKASGPTTSGTISTTASKGLITGADSPLQFTAFNGTNAPLTIQGAGFVTLSGSTPVTVNTTAALGVGDYTLISKGPSGTVNGTAPTALTIGGSGIASGTTGSLVITGAQLILRVVAGDSTPPDTTIDTFEPNPTNDTTGDFTFSSNEPGTFQCSVDGGPFAVCTSPFSTAPLADGSHTFAVTAIDAASNVDPTPASYAWTVDTAAPQTTIDSTPSNPSTDPTGDFTFSSTEVGTFACSIDGGAFTACTSPFATAPLSNGPHTFAVRATDAAGNTDGSPATFAWTVAAGVSFSGPVNVGAAEAIPSLTNPGGLFDQINAGSLSGNLTVTITSDMTGETGTHALNQPAETGVGGYTVFFQASGGARLIEGSNATGLIVLNGADRVTFSGLAFGPGGLLIRNTGVGAAIRFVNDASNNSIVNCTVEGGTSGIANGVVMIGAGSTTGNDNNAISDSTIRDRTDAAAVPLQLLYIDGSGAATSSGITISNNRFINFDLSAITSSAAENLTISGNTISQTAARTSGLGPIQVLLNQGSSAVSGNTVRDHSTNSTFTGLRIQGNVGSIGVSANRIHNIDNAPGSAGQLTGVELDGSSGASSVAMVNNMISITPGTASAQAVIGVNDLRTAGSLTMNYNSVLVGGTATGSNSWAYRRVTGAASSVSLTGNLLFNNRTGPVDNFAIGDQSPGGGSWASNYNLFVGTGSTAANFFDAGGAAVDFAAWKSGPPARDANSIAGVSGTGPFNVANIFSSANDLHLVIGGFNPAINAGTEIGLSTDFDGQTRPFNGAPDIGADEVQTVPTAAEVSVGGRITTADGRGIRNIRVTVSGGDLAGPRSAITSAFGYWQVEGLTAGQSYVVSVGAKRYLFDPPARLVSPTDSMADVDFVGTLR